ncbi:hypothetical protein VTK26DRAFT_9319 [Humicola hyalothermophila]
MTSAPTPTSFPSIPLTTILTRPEACNGIYKPEPRTVFMIDDQPSCLPSGFATDENTYFSPGVACPSGYWSACSNTNGVRTITTVTCCPVYDNAISLSCHNNPETLGNRWESLFCTWVAPPGGGPVTFTQSSLGPTGTEATTLTPPQGINAFGIRMLYQSTDSFSSSNPPSQTGTESGPEDDQTETGSTMPSTNSGLSTAATAAVAVVIPVLAVLAALGFFLWWRSRRALRAATREQQASLAVPEKHHYPKAAATSTFPGAELPAAYHGVELPSFRAAAELPASPRRF